MSVWRKGSPHTALGVPVAQLVRNPLARWETCVRCPGWEDPLEEGRLPTPVFWPGEFHGLHSPRGHKESDTTERLSLSYGIWWECNLVPRLWKTVWSFLKKLKVELPHDPAIPLLGIDAKKPQNINSKRYMHLNVDSSIISNSQDMKAT